MWPIQQDVLFPNTSLSMEGYSLDVQLIVLPNGQIPVKPLCAMKIEQMFHFSQRLPNNIWESLIEFCKVNSEHVKTKFTTSHRLYSSYNS